MNGAAHRKGGTDSRQDPGHAAAKLTPLQGWLRRRGPWVLLSIGLVTLVAFLSLTQPLPRVDQLLQDSARAALAPPPSDDIVIVAIDEKSLAAIGRWPWRRVTHAELLDRIAAQSPKCIGLNLRLIGPDTEHPDDDAALAQAIRDSRCTVLPASVSTLKSQQLLEWVPAPVLAEAATGIGHTRLAFDQDGVVRSVYLYEGFAGRMRPHFALALRDAALGHAEPPPPTPTPMSGPWLRSDQRVLLFTRGPGRFTTVSYIDVLQGKVPPDVFGNRYVLVGATAPSLGDVHANTSPDVPGLMSGVEVFANVLQTLTDGRAVVIAKPWQDLLFNLAPLAVALLGVLWLRPLGVIALIGAMLALQLGIHLGRPSIGVLFAPAAGVTGLLLLYPLWSLMRLSAAVRHLQRGTAAILRDMGRRPAAAPKGIAGDFLDRQMEATRAAVDSMRDMHRFVRDVIDHLPDATITLDPSGHVVLANAASLAYWARDGSEMIGADAHALMAGIRRRTTGAPMMPPGALLAEPEPITGECVDAQARTLLLRCVPFFNADNAHAGWVIALVDITELRRAQSQRDEALRFISHDAREPSASILTILELARQTPDVNLENLLAGIERKARTGLELADGFVNLARAEAERFHPEALDIVALVQQAIDDGWAHARKQQVRMLLTAAPEEALCIADRTLLMRALTNVLSNALKYSPRGADLECAVHEQDRHWRIAFRDHGPGIPVELQSQLFQPFHRLHHKAHPEVHGVGLGLLLVRTVAQRHGGTVEIDSAEGAGCTVTLVLPKPTAAELEALAPTQE
ncbi:CHASE2 domain-containing protein [Variovorax sp. Sphag1AA]|uniref:CHASE2 domain-containing protein n=1 Tax=Variovorax sp. Sphag1AA TaxID=2587027 RepID=UPI00160CFD8C|nr:CHASE2 domain-containing protein [Variovorax sp. Sphag1AA]MBB3180657.1 CHASE2 domain-containing sensor protein/signal transduction histidine kinase [Variovorax sp. Sphag1AA]